MNSNVFIWERNEYMRAVMNEPLTLRTSVSVAFEQIFSSFSRAGTDGGDGETVYFPPRASPPFLLMARII